MKDFSEVNKIKPEDLTESKSVNPGDEFPVKIYFQGRWWEFKNWTEAQKRGFFRG